MRTKKPIVEKTVRVSVDPVTHETVRVVLDDVQKALERIQACIDREAVRLSVAESDRLIGRVAELVRGMQRNAD